MSTGLYTTTLFDLHDVTLEERPQAQVDRLTEMLAVQNCIKEGAQNLLSMRDLVADPLRKQLVSELDQALAKIEFIQRRIEILTAAT